MEVSKIYEDWIEISTTGDKQVSQRLLQALNASSYKELSFKFPKDMQVSSGVYVTSVKFDEDTNTFTFVMSDGTEVVAAVTGGGSEIDLSNYATKQDLNTRVEYYDNDRIALKNHRNLLGYNSDGTENYNLAMVSKWNIADFGSTKIPLNLNSSIKPTVQVGSNEAVELSTSKDISDLSKSIDSKLENKVSYSDGRIELKNHKNLLGYNEDGTVSYNLAMVSKWGIADFGSSKIPLNLNSSVRPTIQLPGQTGDTAERVAFISDIHLSKDDKVKLNSIENGAQVNIIESISVNGIDLPIEDKKINIDTITESEVNIKLNSKVDKVNGKSLSTNDFTNDDKSKLDSLENYDDTEVRDLINEVDSKITGQINTYTKPEIDEKLSEKVDKVEGKDLSTNDFTNEDKESLNSSIKYSTFQGNRKTIQLANYDSISGIKTDGTGVNLAMVSKWDIADFGSSSIHFNINSEDRPTVQLPGQSGDEAEKIAFLSDITDHIDAYTKGEVDSKLVQKANLSDIPSELPSPESLTIKYNGETKGVYDGSSSKEVNIIVTADTLTGLNEKIVEVTSDKVDKVQGKGLSTNDFTNEDKSELSKLRTDVDYVGGLIPEMNTNTENALNTKVDWDSEKKVISLPKDGSISALRDESTLEGGVLLAQRTYDNGTTFVTEVGTTKNSLTLNSTNRPQIDIKGSNSEKIAYLSDIDISIKSDIISISSRLNELEDKIVSLKRTNIEPVVINGVLTEELNDNTKDYQVVGTISSGLPINISGKSVTIKDSKVSNDSRLNIKSVDDVDIKSVIVSGEFPKSNGNAVVKLNGSGYITIKDMTFNANLYNAIEIGLDNTVDPVKGVLIDNCKFLGSFSNNAILIFGTQDNSVININNCYFENVSNAIRLSNRTNTKSIVNITNCRCDHWDTNSPWQGLLICQDYTSGSIADEESNNLFGEGKVTINVSNLTCPDGSILNKPDNISTICGTLDSNQIFYVWNSKGGSIPYGDGSRYPIINII